MKQRQLYKFGDYSLDATAKILFRSGEPVHVVRRAVETLQVLAEHPGQVLTKEELIEAIWHGRVVDEANLMQSIALARKALQLKPGEPGYIETFSGRGYRMLGPVVVEQEIVVPVEEGAAPNDAEPAAAARTGKFHNRLWWSAALLAVVIPAALVLWWRGDAQTRLPGLQRRTVARLDGREFEAALSPDGKDLAFVLDRGHGDASRIWVKLAGQPQARMIGAPDWSYSSPAWSSDGKRLAYLRFGRTSGELIVTSREPGAERVVASVFKTRHGLWYNHLTWSSDDKWLAVDDAGEASEPFAIFLISPVTGERRRLTMPPAHYIGDVEPRFSPDGRYLSFIRVMHRSTQALHVMFADGSAQQRITQKDMQVSGHDWTADGTSLVFAADLSHEFRLWRLPARKLDGAPTPDPSGIYADAPIQFSIARGGPALVYSVLRQDFNIWQLNVGVENGDPLRWTPIITSTAQDASPQYSPDGREICFRSDRTGEEQIWTALADGSNPQQVTRGALNPSVGRWSPDGQSIVFNDSRSIEVYVARRQNGAWTANPLGVLGVHPVYSPDGRWIYTGRNDAARENIMRVPAASGPAETVSKGHGLSFGVSPDGQYLYFVKEMTDSALWRLSLKTGVAEQVLDGLVPYCTSCWAVAAGGVYYLGTAKTSTAGQAIFFHSFHGGAGRVVIDYPEPVFPLGSGPFSLSPDGRHLLCVRMDAPRADVIRAEPYR